MTSIHVVFTGEQLLSGSPAAPARTRGGHTQGWAQRRGHHRHRPRSVHSEDPDPEIFPNLDPDPNLVTQLHCQF